MSIKILERGNDVKRKLILLAREISRYIEAHREAYNEWKKRK